jgi:hypothetical protein
MNTEQHPVVQKAIATIEYQLFLVKLDFPDLPPRAQLQIARSRCVDEITAANAALDLKPVEHLPTAPGQARPHLRG